MDVLPIHWPKGKQSLLKGLGLPVRWQSKPDRLVLTGTCA